MRKFGLSAAFPAVVVLSMASSPSGAVLYTQGLELAVEDKVFTFTDCIGPTLVGSAIASACSEISISPDVEYGGDPLSNYDDLIGFQLGFFMSADTAGSSATFTLKYTVDVEPGSLLSDAHLIQVGTASPNATVTEKFKWDGIPVGQVNSNGLAPIGIELCFGPPCTRYTYLDVVKTVTVAYDSKFPDGVQLSLVSQLFSQRKDEGPPGNDRVPEPMTLAMFGTGLAGIGAMRRRRKPSN